ncbi:MAG: PhzF family phenazine biosynthesis isomerase [Cyanobacteria bacterium J06638_7]
MSAAVQPSAALPALLVEAFAEGPCSGNGAAVVLLSQPLECSLLQRLAASLKQSETAFLLRDGRHWLLRWFTPSCEVKLCGHATLAATLALGHWGDLQPGVRLDLHSRSGPLAVQLDTSCPGAAQIELPADALHPESAGPELEAFLQRHLQSAAEACWHSALGYRVVLLPAAAPLAAARLPAEDLPDTARQGLVLMQGLGDAAPTVLGRPCHYQLRFLAPGLGIAEDPVTGSAHALVAPWWLERLALRQVVGWQCSHRPGGMVCESTSSGMIRLCGTGHLLWDGSLRLEPWPGAERPSRLSSSELPAEPGAAGPGSAWAAWRSLIA